MRNVTVFEVDGLYDALVSLPDTSATHRPSVALVPKSQWLLKRGIQRESFFFFLVSVVAKSNIKWSEATGSPESDAKLSHSGRRWRRWRPTLAPC